MSSYNKVILLGNLTRTPELRSTPRGTQLADLTLAVNENFTDGQGNKQERTSFVDCTAWGKLAETLCRWKKKGDPLLIEGRLQQDKWTDKETGQNRSKLKVMVSGFTFIGSAASRGDGKQKSKQSGGKQSAPADGPGGYDDYATSLPDGGNEPPF